MDKEDTDCFSKTNKYRYSMSSTGTVQSNPGSFSSVAAEILAASISSDRSGLMAQALHAVPNSPTPLPLILTVDPLGLRATISIVRERRDYTLIPTVARLRDSFETGELSVLQWVPGNHNIADALIKRNTMIYRTLKIICVTSYISRIYLKYHRLFHCNYALNRICAFYRNCAFYRIYALYRANRN